MTEGTCSLPDCHAPIKRRGFCYGHYMKDWRYGTPTPTFAPAYTDLTGQRFGLLLVTARAGKRWLCRCDCGTDTHVTPGSLNSGTTTSCGDRAVHHRRDDITYCTAHDRVRADRGRVQDYACIGCGAPANHWSYDHADPDERLDDTLSARPVAYSVKPEHYDPRCVTCHRRFDVAHALARPA